ncbi:hypothetical protein T03_14574 [Trichinella britovi]|uniref:Uncharacterized protein n=2 Tax=Trichinella TaxID=6333 RepID=A0A0V0T9I3_9BILA|nr:hypothetical protein T05_13286 [Trichinella murrelli]KRX35677.1 hypothetical protein T05_1695 [Trichinella murrelli]KRY45239.1 hypothetical protein T03_14574 [Trichinella britovi]
MRTLLVTLIDQKCTVRTFETKDNLHKQVCKRFIRQRTQRRLILVKIAPSAPSVCLSTVSRPVELSLQSSFQLSLAVLVRYRSHLPPALGCSLKQPDSIRSRDTMHKTSFVMGPAPALKPQSREPTN